VLIAIRETEIVTKAMAPALLEQSRRKGSPVIGRNAKADRDASLESPGLDIQEMPALAGPATATAPGAVAVAALPTEM